MITIADVTKEVSKQTGADINIVDQVCKHVFKFTEQVMKDEEDLHDILFAGLFKFKLKTRFKDNKTKRYSKKYEDDSKEEDS